MLPWFKDLAAARDYGATDAGDQAAWAAAIKSTNHQHPDHDTADWPLKRS
jgi:hypothetical protein